MSVADLFDQIVSVARLKSVTATKTYEHRVAVLGERVRVRAQDDRHRRGVTRESIARGGAILLPADAIDLSPHSPIEDVPVTARPAGGAAEETQTTADARHTPEKSSRQTGFTGSSFEDGWLTDR